MRVAIVRVNNSLGRAMLEQVSLILAPSSSNRVQPEVGLKQARAGRPRSDLSMLRTYGLPAAAVRIFTPAHCTHYYEASNLTESVLFRAC